MKPKFVFAGVDHFPPRPCLTSHQAAFSKVADRNKKVQEMLRHRNRRDFGGETSRFQKARSSKLVKTPLTFSGLLEKQSEGMGEVIRLTDEGQ